MSIQNTQNTPNISPEELKYWVAFTKIYSIGPKRFEKLLSSFNTMQAAWHAPITALEQAGFDQALLAEVLRMRREINPNLEMERMEKERVHAVTVRDQAYPALLKEIYSAPPVLFYRGTLPSPDDFLIAVVGTRKHSSYGQQVAEMLCRELAENKLTIVSGLALGIDTIAHRATLEARGKTIAVLGCGIEKANVYPAANRFVAERMIAEGGCIVSEHPIGTPPLRHHFPQRNRIISGLSLGTLVIEAPAESGALLTARDALDQNREVFAIPGNITSPNAEGVNNLIKMGARLVTSAADVLDTLNLKRATEYLETRKAVGDTPDEAKILAHLTREPMHADELTRLTELSVGAINAALTLMEMKGMVRHLGAMRYVLAR